MSDRLAVFNEGRIEQVGPPAEVYEHPAERVHRGLRRRLERDRAGRAPLHRPAGEDPHPRRRRGSRAGGACGGRRRHATSSVRRADDPATTSTLDRGGELQVLAQNLEDDLERGARGEEGAACGSQWRPEQESAIDQQREGTNEASTSGVFRSRAALALLVGALAVVAAGCGGDDDESGANWQIEGLGSSLEEIQENAKRRGPGQHRPVGRGTRRCVDEFTAATGCKVNTKDAGTGDDMISLIQSGEYDGVSASGHTSVRLMAAGDVAPVNADLLPNYADISGRHQAPVVQLASTASRTARRTAAARTCSCSAPTRSPRRRTAGRSSGTRTTPTRARSRSTTTRSSSRTPRCT